jgi:hypothetical protein
VELHTKHQHCSRSSSLSSNSSAARSRSPMARTRTMRSPSYLVMASARASVEAYRSLASVSIFCESVSCLLMIANCIFSNSSLLSRCSYLAIALALSEAVRSLSREGPQQKVLALIINTRMLTTKHALCLGKHPMRRAHCFVKGNIHRRHEGTVAQDNLGLPHDVVIGIC